MNSLSYWSDYSEG